MVAVDGTVGELNVAVHWDGVPAAPGACHVYLLRHVLAECVFDQAKLNAGG